MIKMHAHTRGQVVVEAMLSLSLLLFFIFCLLQLSLFGTQETQKYQLTTKEAYESQTTQHRDPQKKSKNNVHSYRHVFSWGRLVD